MCKLIYNTPIRNLFFATFISLVIYIFYTNELELSGVRITWRSFSFNIIQSPNYTLWRLNSNSDSNTNVVKYSTSKPKNVSEFSSGWTQAGTHNKGPGAGTNRRKQNPAKIGSIALTELEIRHGNKLDELSCNLPILNPFDKSVLKFIKPPMDVVCTRGNPPSFTTDFNSNLLQLDDLNKYSLKNCCYRSFKREDGHRDNDLQISKICIPITSSVTKISSEMEFIEVQCENTTVTNNTELSSSINKSFVVVEAFVFVRLKPETEKRIEEYSKKEKLSGTQVKRRKANVVILGLDAMSHMNLIRTLPKSYAYLTQNLSAIGLWGYTKVGDNTFPNIVPVLTGLSINEIKKSCWKHAEDPFDPCPFIWKNYSRAGFRTAFGEDAVHMAIFNYFKGGFRRSPTDYYFHPLTSRQAHMMPYSSTYFTQFCYGPRLGFQVMLDQLKKMAVTMNKDKRYFQFIWTTSLFHNFLNSGKLGDEYFLQTLSWLKTEGYFEDTVFIVMSDHGIRYGDIIHSKQGKLEQRMPFLYFVLPKWFWEQYPTAVSSLIANKHRLTTPFDLHETLKDLLHLENITPDKIRERYLSLQNWKESKSGSGSSLSSNSSSNFPRGISQFLPIPLKRTCADADIDDQWCVCHSTQSVILKNNTIVGEAARSLVHHINEMFITFPQCKTLQLKQIISAAVFHAEESGNNTDISSSVTNSTDSRLEKKQVTFSVSIHVKPSNATFEATTTRHTNGRWVISGEISRTNLFGNQSHCVTDYNLKKFCYCG